MRYPVNKFAAAMVAGVAMASAGGAAQAVNLIQNGGFELPDVAGYGVYSVGQSFAGWTVAGSGNVAPIDTGFPAFGILNAQAGGQWVDMTGTTTVGAGIQQSVTTEIGQLYRISFWVGNANTNGPASTSTIKVRINNVEIFAATNSLVTPGSQVWKEFTTDFTAAGTSTLVAFYNGDGGGDDNNGLDSISLEAVVGGGVPEPAAWALMILGFGGAGAALRRRRGQTAIG